MDKDVTKKLLTLFDSEDGELFKPKEKIKALTSDQRLEESFRKITEFVEQNNRLPEINSTEIGEALLAQRLEAIRSNLEKVGALKYIDKLGLLELPKPPKSIEEMFENDGLFNTDHNEILNIKNVPISLRSPVEPKATRKKTKGFENFKKGFIEQQKGLKEGELKLVKYYTVGQLNIGSYYVHDNQMLKIVEVGEKKRVYDRNKERFRIIFENGTESNMYRRSLSARLYENGYCVVDKKFVDKSQVLDESDAVKGYIYVLASESADPKISMIRDLYKIGFSKTPVEQRIKNAEKDPTYLMAPVKVVDSYIVTNDFNPQKIEYFLHRIFADAALDLEIVDKSGRRYKPIEWYSVPLSIINKAVNLLQDGEIIHYFYDKDKEKLVLRNDN